MRKGAAAHRRFSAKQSEPTPIDACCDRRQACDSICGTSTKFCDAELKSCADKACDDAPDKEECDRKKSMMQLMQFFGSAQIKFRGASLHAIGAMPARRRVTRRTD